MARPPTESCEVGVEPVLSPHPRHQPPLTPGLLHRPAVGPVHHGVDQADSLVRLGVTTSWLGNYEASGNSFRGHLLHVSVGELELREEVVLVGDGGGISDELQVRNFQRFLPSSLTEIGSDLWL